MRAHVLSGLGVAALVGCLGTYETVTYQDPTGAALLDDDAPAPTPLDASLDFVDRDGILTNFSDKRFRFDVSAHRDDAERRATATLHASHGAALRALKTGGAVVLPSVQTVTTYAKQLDDTIYAGIERALQDGLPEVVAPKREILEGALAHLLDARGSAEDTAAVHVAAALRLGGATAAVPVELEDSVARELADFGATPEVAKPIGFYTWSDALRAVWAQDRFLQVALDAEAACALAAAIAAEPTRRARYEALVSLYSKITHPAASLVERLELRGAACVDAGPAAFLGVSSTPEGALYNRLYGGHVPPEANLMADLVAAIRDGRLDLTPRPEDGWYAHQLHALETLLVTDHSEERRKVAFTARYKRRLREAFQTIAVQHRETHVKQAGRTESVAFVVPLAPSFTVEPTATVYVRHARGYVFLEAAVDALYPGLLDAGVAVGADGPERSSLRERIHRARDLYYGLYVTACFELGMAPVLDRVGDPDVGGVEAMRSATYAWAKALEDDPVAHHDVRVVVPVATLSLTQVRYWAVIGVRATLASYTFIDEPSGHETRAVLPTEQFLEYTASPTPPTREELRALCDAQKTAEAIQAALERL